MSYYLLMATIDATVYLHFHRLKELDILFTLVCRYLSG
jgi:hypothetical protein